MAKGRPKVSDEVILETLELIAQGMSITKACNAAGMSHSTFHARVSEPAFSDKYAKAMDKRADKIFDEMQDIADGDDSEPDNSVKINRDRLRVDTRKWIVSKMLPKKYGDKVTNELIGADGKDLIPEKIVIEIVKAK